MVAKSSLGMKILFVIIVAVSLVILWVYSAQSLWQLVSTLRLADYPCARGDQSDSVKLYSSVRVLCWVMTSPTTIQTKAVHVHATWGRRCNKVLFMSSKNNSLVPTVALPVLEGREYLTNKSFLAFDYIYQHYRQDYDWFLKADDDTYVIVENLRYLLRRYSPTEPIVFGHLFKKLFAHGYSSGGAGYVLSSEALRRLVTEGISTNRCPPPMGAEDVDIATCLHQVGVTPGDSRDYLGRETFHPFAIQHHITGYYPNWYYDYAYHTPKKGVDCCSEYSISFHYVNPDDMYALDYFIYHMRVFGRK